MLGSMQRRVAVPMDSGVEKVDQWWLWEGLLLQALGRCRREGTGMVTYMAVGTSHSDLKCPN